jgi:O-methyltransferase involved in polyketide biosynthesis
MIEGGAIFKDPFALRILDEQTAASLNKMAADEWLRPWRLFIAARSRFSEDTMANSVGAAVPQVVVLGAGLDTFSCEIRLPTSASAYSKSIMQRHNYGSASG